MGGLQPKRASPMSLGGGYPNKYLDTKNLKSGVLYKDADQFVWFPRYFDCSISCWLSTVRQASRTPFLATLTPNKWE